MNNEVLNSWKEIAAYMGRGVRTVQRWEQELGLPVRRPRGKERSAVIALKPDLDRWLHKVPQGAVPNHNLNPHRHDNLHFRTAQLLQHTRDILEHSTRIQETVKATLALTLKLKEYQAERMRERTVRANGQSIVVTTAIDLASSDRKFAGGACKFLTVS